MLVPQLFEVFAGRCPVALRSGGRAAVGAQQDPRHSVGAAGDSYACSEGRGELVERMRKAVSSQWCLSSIAALWSNEINESR